GLPSLYEARGEFQLGVEGMRRAGLGALFEAFERLKAKLGAEGLFDVARKRPLPSFPKCVGIVTSLQAAALRDVLTTLNRRAPMIEIIVYPTAVQGATAPQEIATAIDAARARREVEVLVLCRGGGSIEDLWSFNAEVVARAIARMQSETDIPVVSGVGHETDFTICDFVADQRAPTPTAAAEMISPDSAQLRAAVQATRTALSRTLRRSLDSGYQRVDRAQRSLLSPQDRIDQERERLGRLTIQLRRALFARVERAGFATALRRQRMSPHRPDTILLSVAVRQRGADLKSAADNVFADHYSRLQGLAKALQLLAPARVLERGYSIVELNGMILRDSADVCSGDTITVRLARGQLTANVRPDK
ncbi:MAG: exodeoxyribonuclease VII large subunit, partial [Betaproteobacteria bacterium]